MSDIAYPLASIRFEVDWGGGLASFAEVSGLNVETDIAEYRGGADASLTTRKIPGLMKYSNVSLKRGVIAKDNDFFDWWIKNQQGTHEPRPVTIKLMNEAGEETVSWALERAWPVKVEGPSLNAKGNDVALESIELCHEGVTIKHT